MCEKLLLMAIKIHVTIAGQYGILLNKLGGSLYECKLVHFGLEMIEDSKHLRGEYGVDCRDIEPHQLRQGVKVVIGRAPFLVAFQEACQGV